VGTKDSPGGQTWTSREIDFAPKDAPLERWRAAGFAAGTLASLVVKGEHSRAGSTPATAGEETAPRAAETAAPPAASTGSESTAEAPSKERPSEASGPRKTSPPEPPERDDEGVEPPHRTTTRVAPMWAWAFDAAGLFGSGVTMSHPRIGGLVRVNRVFGGPFVTMSLGYAVERPMFIGLSMDWILPSLGAGYVARLGPGFSAEVRIELLAELLHGHAVDASRGDQSTAYRWLGGARLGLGAAWTPFDAVSILVGGTLSARGPETDIVMRGVVQASTSIAAYQLEAGVRFMLR
jgi:hypothetical protein